MDLSWLATEAKMIHQIFQNLFFYLITTLLLFGVAIEYFKLPLGGMPQFSELVGRSLIACLLLVALPEIMNALASVTDALTKELGGLNEFKNVLSRIGDKLGTLSFSWVSIKDSIILLVSFLTFMFLYITVYLADALFLYTWFLLYIFSPLLIALFVLPVTANATKMLFKSLIEVCIWKIIWCVMASLLWSMALSNINQPDQEIDFLTAIIMNIMLAFSVLITPMITSSFTGGGVSAVANGIGGLLFRFTPPNPVKMNNKGADAGKATPRSVRAIRSRQETANTSTTSSQEKNRS